MSSTSAVLSLSCRCGVALDCWMVPVDESELVRIQQPLLFINSDLDFQGPAAVKKMLKAVKPVDKQGTSYCLTGFKYRNIIICHDQACLLVTN